jgi:Mg2+ and Co2+ transporter CorA
VIVEWVSKSLAQALYVDQQIHEDRYIEQTQFLQHKAFETRLEQEKRRQAEFELDYLLLKYKLDDIRFEDVHEKITRVLRSVDVYSFIEEEQTILVLLPATPLSAVEMINERIMKNLDYKVSQIQNDL